MLKRTAVVVGALALVTVLAPAAMAQTVDEIIAKNYATKGGLAKWKSIQTMKMTGAVSAQGMELGLTIYGKRPNLGRQEVAISIPGGPSATIVNIFDGTKVWMINPMTGSDAPTEMPGAQGDMIREQSDFDGALIDYKEKGSVIELVGIEAVGAKKAHHLKIVRKSQSIQHYYLDVETGVELKVTIETPDGLVEQEMSDYRTIDGIMVAHSIKVSTAGQVQGDLRISKVEFGIPLEDALFKVK